MRFDRDATRGPVAQRGAMTRRPSGSWLSAACERSVVLRALRVAAFVGTVLVAINYGDRALAGRLERGDFLKMLITYCVPYAVSTYSAVQAIRSHAERSVQPSP